MLCFSRPTCLTPTITRSAVGSAALRGREGRRDAEPLCFDELIVVRSRGWPLHADQNLGRHSAADTHAQPARASDGQVARRQVRSLRVHDARERAPSLRRRLFTDASAIGCICVSPHSRNAARDRGACARRRSTMAGCGDPIVRLREASSISCKESVEQRFATAAPIAPTERQVDRAQEPNDVHQRRASRRIVEIIETPCVLGDRELFDVRVPVQTYDRHVGHVCSEHLAHARDPGPVDEPEVIRSDWPAADRSARAARARWRRVRAAAALGRRCPAQHEAHRYGLDTARTGERSSSLKGAPYARAARLNQRRRSASRRTTIARKP